MIVLSLSEEGHYELSNKQAQSLTLLKIKPCLCLSFDLSVHFTFRAGYKQVSRGNVAFDQVRPLSDNN